MNKEEIKKQIDDATRIFKETLEKTFLKESTDFHGIGIHHLQTFFTGKCNQQRKSNGNLRISGELPDIMFNKECTGLPMKNSDWDILPMVITLLKKKFD